jgi:polyphosphate kinase
MKCVTIFDLDGTCIDSSHRQATLADGTLNLALWIKNATPEKIANDSLLPLSKEIRNRKAKGDYVVICTARNMSDADVEFLKENDMMPHKIISRPRGNMEGDAVLKAKQLRSLFSLKQFANAAKIMFDDAASVRGALRKLDIAVLHPSRYN